MGLSQPEIDAGYHEMAYPYSGIKGMSRAMNDVVKLFTKERLPGVKPLYDKVEILRVEQSRICGVLVTYRCSMKKKITRKEKKPELRPFCFRNKFVTPNRDENSLCRKCQWYHEYTKVKE
jgi:hypothetical protein